MKKVLVSVSHISGYLMASLEELRQSADIAIYQTDWRLTPRPGDADYARYRWLSREKLKSPAEVLTALGAWRPDIFICAGWADKTGLELARYYHTQGVKTVLCCDTPWENRPKQWINCLVARFLFVRDFDFAWAAGPSQRAYMRHIGFKSRQIYEGYYAADTKKFASLYVENRNPWPHAFLFVGRYAPEKNVVRMQRAFVAACEAYPESDWKLRCIGDGELWEARMQHPKIEHLGYKRPEEIQDYVRDAGCFVLSSLREPWGVVVQENALMGLPLLCSNRVQACRAYLKEGENGFTFDPLDEAAMREAFIKVMKMSDGALRQMGERSHRLGLDWTNEKWADLVLEMAT